MNSMKEKLTEEMKLVKEKETKMKIELDQLRVENKWLINEKKGKDGKENDKEEMERFCLLYTSDSADE